MAIVQPVNAVPTEKLLENIEGNELIIPSWIVGNFKVLPPHKRLLVISAGPSLKTHLPEIKRLVNGKDRKNIYTMCVKHALPTLSDYGIVPDVCVTIDPRPLEGISTHGEKRKDLLLSADRRTKFFLASQTDYNMAYLLLNEGYDVVGWHAAIKEVGMAQVKNKFMVYGGTSSAIRSVNLGITLGFRNIDLIGFDSCNHDGEVPPFDTNVLDKHGRPKYMAMRLGDGSVVWSTGELVAQIQDLDALFGALTTFPAKLNVWPGGVAKRMYDYHVKMAENLQTSYAVMGRDK